MAGGAAGFASRSRIDPDCSEAGRNPRKACTFPRADQDDMTPVKTRAWNRGMEDTFTEVPATQARTAET